MDPREQIKSKIDIVQFIQEYIPLKQVGRNFKTLCPFHGEKSPSFVVSPERQIWHCFGCNLGGDCFTFLMEYEKMDFLEALRTLAKRTGVKLRTFLPNKAEQVKEKLLEINHLTSEFYHYILVSHKIGEWALDYLKTRAINKRTIETFKLGFAPAKWDLLTNYLTKKKGFSESEVEQAGLIIRSQNYYDRFRNRIMFTLRDHRGNIVGFAGRLLDPNAKEAKYINTPETPIYHKGELFYGLDVAKEAIKKENQAIIVEGEFDMLASFQSGVSNVIALKGTALTEMQARLLRRFTQNIALAFDVDFAGDAAARRGIEIADSEGLNIKVIRLKAGKDPDEEIRKNLGNWKKAIKEAVSVYDFFIDSALSRFDKVTPEGKKDIANEVIPHLSSIGNEIVKAHFIKRLARELDVAEEAILKEIDKIQKPKPQYSQESLVVKAKRPRYQLLEEYLIALLLQKPDRAIMGKIRLEVEPEFFQTPTLRRVFEALCTFYERGTKDAVFTIRPFIHELPKELIPTVDTLYLLDIEGLTGENILFEVERIIQELRVLLLKKNMEGISYHLREKEKVGDTKRVTALKKEFTLLSTKLLTLTQERTEGKN